MVPGQKKSGQFVSLIHLIVNLYWNEFLLVDDFSNFIKVRVWDTIRSERFNSRILGFETKRLNSIHMTIIRKY